MEIVPEHRVIVARAPCPRCPSTHVRGVRAPVSEHPCPSARAPEHRVRAPCPRCPSTSVRAPEHLGHMPEDPSTMSEHPSTVLSEHPCPRCPSTRVRAPISERPSARAPVSHHPCPWCPITMSDHPCLRCPSTTMSEYPVFGHLVRQRLVRGHLIQGACHCPMSQNQSHYLFELNGTWVSYYL